MRVVRGVPCVLEVREYRSAVARTEGKMALGVVGFTLCGTCKLASLFGTVPVYVPSANSCPATWWSSGSPAGYSLRSALQLIMSFTKRFRVGSPAGKHRNSVNKRPLLCASEAISPLLYVSRR